MKAKELRELPADELAAKIREAKAALADMRVRHASKAEVEKPGRMREMRRHIARMLTVQNEAKKKEAK